MKSKIIEALRGFINQRPGLEFANYGDISAYRADYRTINRQLHDARELLQAVEWYASIDAKALIYASQHAFSGRLTITVSEPDKVAIDYITGQYFPTEYRAAVCAVLARALWNYYWVEYCETGGAEVRAQAKKNLSSGVYKRWFK